jgi:hypothetical protein
VGDREDNSSAILLGDQNNMKIESKRKTKQIYSD